MVVSLARRLILSALALATTGCLAEPGLASSRHSRLECPVGFPTAGRLSRTIQSLSGINWLTEEIVSRSLSLALRFKVSGSARVRVKIFTFTDLLSGKIRSVDLKMSNSSFKRIPLGHIHLASVNPFRFRLGFGHCRSGLCNPILLTVKVQLSDLEVARALQSNVIASKLQMLKLDLPGIGSEQLRVDDPKVTLGPDKITIQGSLATAGSSDAVPVTITGAPYLAGDSLIMLKNMTVECKDVEQPGEFASFIQDLLNPLVNLQRLDRADHALRLQSMKVDSGLVEFNARLLLAPKTSSSLTAQPAAKGNS